MKNKTELLNTAEELSELANKVLAQADRLEELRADIESENTARQIRPLKVRKNTGSGIPLYYVGEETFVRLNDVLQLCTDLKKKFEKGTEKGFIDPNEKSRISACYALTKLQTQLYKNETEKAKSVDEHKRIIESHSGKNRKPKVCGRYAVARKYDTENDYWMFFVNSEDEKPTFSNRPCMAKLYNSYKEAEACADFMDDSGWEVVDMFEYLSPEQRMCRCILGETSWDDGNENAVRLHFNN